MYIDYVFKHPIHSKNNLPGFVECAARDVYVSQPYHDTLSGLFFYKRRLFVIHTLSGLAILYLDKGRPRDSLLMALFAVRPPPFFGPDRLPCSNGISSNWGLVCLSQPGGQKRYEVEQAS